MRVFVAFAGLGLFFATSASAEQSGSVCLVNQAGMPVVARFGGKREDASVTKLSPGARFCHEVIGDFVETTISVYSSIYSLEGCSRRIGVGLELALINFVEFDRCSWGGGE